MIVEDEISVDISTWYSVGPQFLHEENLVSELWRGTW